MTQDNKAFAVVEGFSICVGSASGAVYIATFPYSGIESVTDRTILLLDYPAATYLRLMYRAAATVASRGTSKIEAANFLRKLGRPAFFGAGDLASRLFAGQHVQVTVRADNTAAIYCV